MSELSSIQLAFRQGMSRLGAAVTLLTTAGPAGPHGMTASAVCSVTDTPPTLLVCVNKSARSHDLFLQNGSIGVNVLASGHEELSGSFARFSEEDRFGFHGWSTLEAGAPLLNETPTAFDCRIVAVRRKALIRCCFARWLVFCRVLAHPAWSSSAGPIINCR